MAKEKSYSMVDLNKYLEKNKYYVKDFELIIKDLKEQYGNNKELNENFFNKIETDNKKNAIKSLAKLNEENKLLLEESQILTDRSFRELNGILSADFYGHLIDKFGNKKSIQKFAKNLKEDENGDINPFDTPEYSSYIRMRLEKNGSTLEEIENLDKLLEKYNLSLASDLTKITEQKLSEEEIKDLYPLINTMEKENFPEKFNVSKEDFKSVLKTGLKTGGWALTIVNLPQGLVIKGAIYAMRNTNIGKQISNRFGNVMKKALNKISKYGDSEKDNGLSRFCKKSLKYTVLGVAGASAGVVAFAYMTDSMDLIKDPLNDGMKKVSSSLDWVPFLDGNIEAHAGSELDQVKPSFDNPNLYTDEIIKNYKENIEEAYLSDNINAEERMNRVDFYLENNYDEVEFIGAEIQNIEELNKNISEVSNNKDEITNNTNNVSSVNDDLKGFIGQDVPQNNYWGKNGSMEMLSKLNGGMDLDSVKVGDKITLPLQNDSGQIVGFKELEIEKGDTVSGLYQEHRMEELGNVSKYNDVTINNLESDINDVDMTNKYDIERSRIVDSIPMEDRDKFNVHVNSLDNNDNFNTGIAKNHLFGEYFTDNERAEYIDTMSQQIIDSGIGITNEAEARNIVENFVDGKSNGRNSALVSGIERGLERDFSRSISEIRDINNIYPEEVAAFSSVDKFTVDNGYVDATPYFQSGEFTPEEKDRFVSDLRKSDEFKELMDIRRGELKESYPNMSDSMFRGIESREANKMILEITEAAERNGGKFIIEELGVNGEEVSRPNNDDIQVVKNRGIRPK